MPLIYSFLTSLDGYINDRHGSFDWATPDPEVHQFFNEQARSAGTYLYGRRLYEVMRVWETIDHDPDAHPVEREFAQIWRDADKIVFSRSLPEVQTTRTHLERTFDPARVRDLIRSAGGDVTVGGADLGAQALRAGLVDEIHQCFAPVIVGGGTRFLPDGISLALDLLEERRFGNGMVFVRYAVRK